MMFGFFQAKGNGIGKTKKWENVQQRFEKIKNKGFTTISSIFSLPEEAGKTRDLWASIVDSLYEDFLLTKAEKTLLAMEDFSFPPQNEEAQRR
jgi:hypothetical protein